MIYKSLYIYIRKLCAFGELTTNNSLRHRHQERRVELEIRGATCLHAHAESATLRGIGERSRTATLMSSIPRRQSLTSLHPTESRSITAMKYILTALLPILLAALQSKCAYALHDKESNGPIGLEALVNQKLRLVKFDEELEARWVLEDDKEALRRLGIKFFDITDHQFMTAHNVPASTSKLFPKRMKFSKLVNQYIPLIESDNMAANLAILTGFHNRYYKSQYGAASGEFLFNLIQNVTSSHSDTISVRQFKHPWGQHSVIARIQGSSSNDTVVIGAHQDSANLFLPSILPAPGADDDGSGTVTILEVLRVLTSVKFVPRNSIEFMWFSAEEGGLLGSQAIFADYAQKGRNVTAMLQQDMTGYVQKTLKAGKQEALGVITDFVDPDLTEFIKNVIKAYCSIPYVSTKCGYACSDHSSATRAGYRSAFVIESDFTLSNPNIHSQNDVIENLSFSHMREHAKLTLGFAIELGETDYKFGTSHRPTDFDHVHL